MKKYNKIAYTVLIIIIILIVFFIYKVYAKNNFSEDSNQKTLSEIKHIEGEFQNLFNQLNNISFENYKISTMEIKDEEKQNQQSSSSSDSGSSGESQKSNGISSSSEGSSESSSQNKEYKLEKTGVLTNDSEMNWKQIKNDVEKIYTSLYSITLDLYQTPTNQQDIVNFNKEYDNLTKAVKSEDKEECLMKLSILYDFLPKFIESCTTDEKEKTLIKTKNNVFKAYSILDKQEWTTISKNINSATQEFTKLVTDINNTEHGNQYNINKAYVIINELQNAVTLKDKEVFLIKYKNLLEELKNI